MLGPDNLLVHATTKTHRYFDSCICNLALFQGPRPAFRRLQNCNNWSE